MAVVRIEFLLVTFSFALIHHVQAVDKDGVNASTFCYDKQDCGPTTWSGLCATGTHQSPIDILKPRIFLSYKRAPKFIMDKNYEKTVAHSFYAENNGHSIQFNMNADTSALASNFPVSGGKLPATYNFAQLHFHWAKDNKNGSEHAIRGRKFPLELHIVHYKNIYPTLQAALAADDRDAVAVMGVLFQLGAHNPALDSILVAASDPRLSLPGTPTLFSINLKLSALYPSAGRQQYATYLGSLTTPSCDEKVFWTVFLEPSEVSQTQLNVFRELKNHDEVTSANFRPLQQYKGDVTFHSSIVEV